MSCTSGRLKAGFCPDLLESFNIFVDGLAQRRIQEFAMGEADPWFQFGGAHGERGSASL